MTESTNFREVLAQHVGQSALVYKATDSGIRKPGLWLATDVRMSVIHRRVDTDGEVILHNDNYAFNHMHFETNVDIGKAFLGIVTDYTRKDGSIGYSVRQPMSPVEEMLNRLDLFSSQVVAVATYYQQASLLDTKKRIENLRKIEQEIFDQVKADKMNELCLKLISSEEKLHLLTQSRLLGILEQRIRKTEKRLKKRASKAAKGFAPRR